VVDLHHQGGDLNAAVDVTYVRGDKGRIVTAGKVVWAGYHTILPYICSDVPKEQGVAMSNSVRAPLVYTNVLMTSQSSCTCNIFRLRRDCLHPSSLGRAAGPCWQRRSRHSSAIFATSLVVCWDREDSIRHVILRA
jgi:hypothetical protein